MKSREGKSARLFAPTCLDLKVEEKKEGKKNIAGEDKELAGAREKKRLEKG